jgi:murein DD-endopeptidase MepM/ murein hydrolase activator NlpD
VNDNNENYVRRRPRLEDARVNTSRKKSSSFLTGFQIGACVFVLAAALVLKQFGGDYYVTAKSYVKEALQNSITSEEVTAVLHSIGEQLPDAAEVFSSGVTTPKSSSSGSSSSQSSQSKAVSNAAGGSSSSASSSTSSSNVKSSSIPTDSVSTLKTLSFSSAGGEDLPAVDSSVSANNSQLPPSTASLAPFRVTIKPVMPVNGRLTSAYGYRVNPITGKYTFHTGMDIAAAGGTPIVAAYAGKAEQVGKSEAYGNFVLLDNGGGIKTFYGHCQTVVVKQGETVKAGETIAKVGSTGESTGNHLHFEIRVNSKFENPQWVI